MEASYREVVVIAVVKLLHICYPKVVGISLAFLILMSNSVTKGEKPLCFG
jgi:hypothetical protein